MNTFAWTFFGGVIQQSITSITLVNNTAKTVDLTVPAGKRWLLNYMRVTNVDDVARNTYCILYKEAAKTNYMAALFSASLGAAGNFSYPTYLPNALASGLATQREDWPLKASNTLSITWAAGGASAGGTDADGLVAGYLEVDV